MIRYNGREIEADFLVKDEVVVEISSKMSLEDILDMLLKGEPIPEDSVMIHTYKAKNGDVQFAEHTNCEPDTMRIRDLSMSTEQYEEKVRQYHKNKKRSEIAQAFEGWLLNRPWRGYDFEECEIDNETLKKELFACIGIMSTAIREGEDIAEMKKRSNAGRHLYWEFAPWSKSNAIPSKEALDFYLSLPSIEQRVLNESPVHPMKVLEAYSHIKKAGKDTKIGMELFNLLLSNPDLTAKSAAQIYTSPAIPVMKFNASTAVHIKIANTLIEHSDIALPALQDMIATLSAKYHEIEFKDDDNFSKFARMAKNAGVISRGMFEKFADPDYSLKSETDVRKEFCRIYDEEFVPFLKGKEPTHDLIQKFVSNYKGIECPVVKRATEVFKEVHGRAPQIVEAYMCAQANKMGKAVHMLTDEDIKKIVDDFSLENVKTIRPFNNPTLLAFAGKDGLNYNEIKSEIMDAIAVFVEPHMVPVLFEKGFCEWVRANKSKITVSDIDLICSRYKDIRKFDVNKTAKDIVLEIDYARGMSECRKMEESYHYKFSDNQLAIRGRHICAEENGMKMYMLQADDYRAFTIGEDTSCCQRYGHAGETCVYKYTTDPFASAVVIEKNGKILAQGFVWTEEATDTLVFDNVEFANDNDDPKKVKMFTNIFAAWCEAMPYKNIHVGIGCNPAMMSWGKKAAFTATMPTTLNNHRCYSDYRNDARSLKTAGTLTIPKTSYVKITEKPDEPTKWDVLRHPANIYLINDCSKPVEERLQLAKDFIESPTPEKIMRALRIYPAAIATIDNPTEEMQKIVIEQNKKLASLIKNPCEAVQKVLIEEDPENIRHIENPTEEMALIAVSQNGLLLSEIRNPSDAVIEAAVRENGFAVRCVPIEKQTERIQMIAVENSPKVATLLHNPSEAVLFEAIERYPSVVTQLENPTRELQLAAVKREPAIINSIKDPDYDAIYRAVKKNGLLVRNFQYKHPQLRAIALEQNGFAIRCLHNPTADEYLMAVRQNPAVANIIPDPELRSSVLAEIERSSSHSDELEIDYE